MARFNSYHSLGNPWKLSFPLLVSVPALSNVFFVCVCFVLLGPHPQHMEVPRLGVELELLRLAYSRATATWDLSRICNLHHSSWQRRIFNPLSKARDRTLNLMVPSRIC